MIWYWLSFCDAKRPAGSQFLGGCLTQAADMGAAVERAHALGINPGGEVMGLRVADQATITLISERWKNRLLTKAECVAMDDEVGRLQQAAGVTVPSGDQGFICVDHNRPRSKA